ncbi:sensor histidine kinase [Nonomuraea thailandensis]
MADSIQDCLEVRGWSDQVTVTASQGLTANLDPSRFDVIVANLVGNALKHGLPPVVVTARATENGLEVKVRDHGRGIPHEALPHVFDRFFKAGAGRARSHGSGLGLAIARANVQLHGGTISVRAQHPGTLFTVWLPHMKAITSIAAALLLAATACGISPTDVQDRGDAPTVKIPPPTKTIYLVKNGRLSRSRPTSRTTPWRACSARSSRPRPARWATGTPRCAGSRTCGPGTPSTRRSATRSSSPAPRR